MAILYRPVPRGFFAQIKKRTQIAGFVWFNRDKGKPWSITTSAKVTRAWSRGVVSLR